VKIGQHNLGFATPNVSKGSPSGAGITSGIDAISRLGEIGAQTASQIASNERALKVAGAATNAGLELEEYVYTMKQNDRDYGTQYDRYQEAVKAIDKRYQEHFKGDNNGYETWKNNFGQMAFKKGFEVRSHSFNGQIDQHKAGLTQNLSSLSELAVSGDEEQQTLVKAKGDLLIQDAYNSGILTAEEGVKAGLQFQDDVVGARVRKDILDDPDGASKKLLEGKYEGLSGEKQMLWLEKATRQSEANLRKQLSEEDRLRREQERHEKEAQELMSKAGDKLLSAGELTEEWIETNRDDISEEDYRYFYKQLRTDSAGVTDRNIYADLRMRASNGEDVREEARTHLRKGQLKSTDYDKLVSRSEQNIGIASVPNWFKRGEQFIGRALQVSDMNPDPAAAQRQASAMDDWQDWALKNPGAEDGQARDAYQRIVKEYALIDYENITLTKPLPRFAVGSRQALDVESSMQQTVSAFQDGVIDEDEFNKQAALLKEWEEAINRKNQGVQ
jgi:hypothetical protein